MVVFIGVLHPVSLSAQASAERAEVLIRNWEFDQAEMLLSREKKKDPGNPELYEKLGDLYGLQKVWDKALENYEALLRFDPGNADYHFKVGGIYGMMALENKLKALGLIDDIKYHFSRAAELDKYHLESRWALIEFYLELPAIVGGSYAKAMGYADELFEISPVEGYLARGYIEDYRDRRDRARENFAQAAVYMERINRSYPRENIHYQFGKIASQYGINTRGGLWHLRQYEMRYNPYSRIGLEWIYYHMALILQRERQNEQALQYLNKSLEVVPGFKPAEEARELLESR